MQFDVTASIVLYQNEPAMVQKAITSFLSSPLRIRLYLVDNSPTDQLKILKTDERIEYRFVGKNIGFGSGHNVAMRESIDLSRYHIVLNPDVYFDPDVVPALCSYMDSHQDVGQIMPQVLYPDGSIQYSGKLLPTPLNLFSRRALKMIGYFRRMSDLYELKDSGYNTIMNVPHHLGCFMMLRSSSLREAGLFDERIFMYMEDVDITRRIHQKYKTLFYPAATIFHSYGKGSRKKFKLFRIHIESAITYFNKWGWWIDRERDEMNRRAVDLYLPRAKS